MPLTITIGLPLEGEEANLLRKLLAVDTAEVAQTPVAKAPKPPAAKAPPAPAPEPEAEPEDDDILGGGEAKPTLEDCVARATVLVGEQRTGEVKAALEAAGAKRVSELKPSKFQGFLDALSD